MTAALMSHPTGARLFLGAMAHAAKPRQVLTVSQWSDKHRMLSSKGSSESGPWRTARTPYLKEPLDCLSVRSPVREVVLMFSTQVGKTEVGLNWIGYVMDHAPAPMLVVVPTLEVRKRWVLQRLDPMLTETPALREIFDAKRKRGAMNSEDVKDFPAGMLVIGGANSPASLSSMPIKYVLCDEVDRFPWEVGTEGDPLGLVRQRQSTFRHRKIVLVSTPTMKDASRIEEEFEQSDQRYYHVPCPHCAELIVLKWDQLRWTFDPTTKEPKHVAYVCEHCGAEIEEHNKPWMLDNGRWIAKHPGRTKRGYHLNALYAPLGLGFRWAELALEWLGVQKDPAKLKRFWNTNLALTWEDRSRDVKANSLQERAESYGLREIPPGCLVLTAGVDVQDNRFAIQVNGWGRGEINWIIDWLEMPCDPSREASWVKLAEYLAQPFTNRFGRELRIEATAVDTGGHYTHESYNFVRRRGVYKDGQAPVRRLMAVKGASTPGRAILGARPQPQDVNYRGKTIKRGVTLWIVGTDTAKHALYARLIGDAKLLDTKPEAEGAQPAEMMQRKVHFSDQLDADFYAQLTAETFDPEHNKWIKRRGRRNEALDCWVYSAAAAQHPEIRVHALRPRDWQRLQDLLEPPTEMPVPESNGSTEPSPTAPIKQTPPRRRASFVNRWKQP